MKGFRGMDRVLLCILVGSLALNWTGDWMSFDHPDEWHLADRIDRAAETGSLNPGYEDEEMGHFAWGGASIAAYLPAAWLSVRREGATDASKRLPYRLWTGVLGMFTVWVVYHLGCAVRGRRSGRLAAMVMAVVPLHVQVSHYVTPDVLGTLFAALALWAGDRARAPGERRGWLLAGSGLSVGCAVATKYTLFSSFLVPVLAAWGPAEGRVRRFAIVGGAMAAGFLIGEPYALVDRGGFWRHLVIEHQAYTGFLGQELAVGGQSHFFYLAYLVRSGLGPVLCAPLVLFLLKGGGPNLRSRRTWIWLGAPALHLAFIGLFPLQYDRNVLPLVPVLSVGVAVALFETGRRWVVASILGASLAVAVLLDAAIVSPSVRGQATDWIRESGIDEDRVYTDHGPAGTTPAQLRSAGYDYVLVDGRITRPLSRYPERSPGLTAFLETLSVEGRIVRAWSNPIVDRDWLVPRWLEHGATFPAYHGARVTLWSLDAEPNRGAQGT